MSKEIVSRLTLDGKEIAHFVTLSIVQQFNGHHRFELVVNQDALASSSHTLQSTQDHIGTFMTIGFGQQDDGDNFFKGIITEVKLKQGHGQWSQLVMTGYSPTFLLEGGQHMASFLDRSLKSVVQDLSGNLAANDLKLVVKPTFSDSIPYLTQYRESHFAFMNRLAVEYGEWFFYDGQNLFFGRPSLEDKVKLIYGTHLHELDFALQLAPTKVTHYSYNEVEDSLSTAETPQGVEESNTFIKKALEISDKLYRKGVQQPVRISSPQQSGLDAIAKQSKGEKAAGTLAIKAKGDHPKVKIGGLVEIHIDHGSSDEQAEFLVTSITHVLSGTGDYSHSFEGISSASHYIPAKATKPVAETQVATVIDNADPKGMGRVRVQMHWQKNLSETTDWIRVLMTDAGSSSAVDKNRGHVFISEKGDQVQVGFDLNDPDRPFVLGSLFHGKNGTGGGKENTIKSIKTRSGHTIEFDDAGKGTSITIKDPGGNSILLDTVGKNITITAPETMTFKAKNVVFDIEENMTTGIGKDMKTTVGANHTLKITEKYEVSSAETKETVEEDKQSAVGGDLKVKTASVKLTSSSGDILIKSSGVATLQGASDARVNKG